ncbi:MAG: hypothetical protein RIQ33_1100 [Bacteroidota bacterium]|jgi:hypothetical protein
MAISSETKSQIFESLKKLLLNHCNPLVISKNQHEVFEVIGNIETTYGSKKEIVPGMYFASLAIRTDSVVFYFFPTYMHEASFKPLAPNTWKCLKGKTCFHFKKLEQIDTQEIDALMKMGIQSFKKQGWVK